MRYTTRFRSGTGVALAALLGLSVLALPALAEDKVLKKGTDVQLAFTSSISSRTAKVGDKVGFKVLKDVQVDDTTVIKAGTPLSGKVVKVTKNGRFGKNGGIQFNMGDVRTVSGRYAPLGFKTKGNNIGSRTGESAGAALGGAAVLGPLGLGAGYFVVGKSADAKPGDKMTVEIAKDTVVPVSEKVSKN